MEAFVKFDFLNDLYALRLVLTKDGWGKTYDLYRHEMVNGNVCLLDEPQVFRFFVDSKYESSWIGDKKDHYPALTSFDTARISVVFGLTHTEDLEGQKVFNFYRQMHTETDVIDTIQIE